MWVYHHDDARFTLEIPKIELIISKHSARVCRVACIEKFVLKSQRASQFDVENSVEKRKKIYKADFIVIKSP